MLLDSLVALLYRMPRIVVVTCLPLLLCCCTLSVSVLLDKLGLINMNATEAPPLRSGRPRRLL